MDFEKFCETLNRHIFEGEKKELLRRIAEKPERFIGLFRPTKPGAKILQHLLQSHEIRMGDALEEILQEILASFNFKILPKNIKNEKGEILSLDQYFTDGKIYYFIEQKIRDDHDSSKKRGQIFNFKTKLEKLYKNHGSQLVGIMYFIDPDLTKNKNYYLGELERFENFYGVKLYLFYGKELFEYFKHPEIWDNFLDWLKKWKEDLPELPEINFDISPQKSFEEIKDLELRYWRKILENENLWEEGIMKAIFKSGETLRYLYKFFSTKKEYSYKKIIILLKEKIEKHFI
ncbi:MAG: restriction endonuclease [bacterium]|nr:restriction endonuclease [bacterium]